MMIALLIGVGVLCAAAFVALFLWVRRSERDVDYDELLEHSTQTENDRRAKQVGIGLTSGPTTFGH